jgi:DNA end-binding protein Ku
MAIRSVPLKLGLISTTVKVASAIDDATPSFNTVCDEGHAPAKVKQHLGCPTCGKQGNRFQFKKGLDQGDGTVVVVDNEELGKASEVSESVKGTITLTTHPAADLAGTTIAGGKVYFLEPSKGEHDTYALMVELVASRPDMAFLSSFAIRGKPALYQLGTFDGALSLVEIAWPENVKPSPRHQGDVDAAMLAMAGQFVDTLVAPYDPALYRDARVEQINTFLETQKAVASGDKDAAVSSGSGDDLMAALAAVVGGSSTPAKKATRKKTTKKATARKAPARKKAPTKANA